MGELTKVDSLCLCGRLRNCIADFAYDRASVAIAQFKTVFCMLQVNTTIFLTLSIVPEILRWLVLPIHPYAFIASLFPF